MEASPLHRYCERIFPNEREYLVVGKREFQIEPVAGRRDLRAIEQLPELRVRVSDLILLIHESCLKKRGERIGVFR